MNLSQLSFVYQELELNRLQRRSGNARYALEITWGSTSFWSPIQSSLTAELSELSMRHLMRRCRRPRVLSKKALARSGSSREIHQISRWRKALQFPSSATSIDSTASGSSIGSNFPSFNSVSDARAARNYLVNSLGSQTCGIYTQSSLSLQGADLRRVSNDRATSRRRLEECTAMRASRFRAQMPENIL